MSDDTEQTSAADETVPNVGPNAVTGHDHDPIERREPSTLAGSYRDRDDVDPPDPYAKPDTDEQASETSETGAEREALDTGANEAEQEAPGTGEPSEGTEVPAGETATLTGDGSGQALPDLEQPTEGVQPAEVPANGDGGEVTGPDGAPIGDASSEQGSGEDSPGAGGPETPASGDASTEQAPREQQG